MPEAYRELHSERRCAELKAQSPLDPEQLEELEFLEDYLRCRPWIEAERLRRCGQATVVGNLGGPLNKIRIK